MGRPRKYINGKVVGFRVEEIEARAAEELGYDKGHIFALGVAVAVEVDCRSENPKLSLETLAEYTDRHDEERRQLRSMQATPGIMQAQADQIVAENREKSDRYRRELAEKGEGILPPDWPDTEDLGVEEPDEVSLDPDPIGDAIDLLVTDAEARALYEKFAGLDLRDRRPWHGKEELWFAAEARKRMTRAPEAAEVLKDLSDPELGRRFQEACYRAYAYATAPGRGK